jgi:energy-coupling factor transporter ATP-binding protein EcfA2
MTEEKKSKVVVKRNHKKTEFEKQAKREIDEIEANLDEANADKFSKILKRLSHKTQFILATHSREVMRMSDILYGITMDSGGYSKVFSVSLSQVKEEGEIKN